jgi:hypothetical protein
MQNRKTRYGIEAGGRHIKIVADPDRVRIRIVRMEDRVPV